MKYVPLYCLLFGVILVGRAQIHEKGFGLINLEQHQVSFNLLMPSFQYEIGLFRNVTASATIGLGLATPEEGYSLSPMYNTKARFYHNLERRKALGKNVSGNSGNYVAFSYSHFFTKWELAGNMNNGDSSLDFFGPLYGVQRKFNNGILLAVDAGYGWYRRDNSNQGMGPSFGLFLGWTPKKKKNNGLPSLNIR